MTPALLCPRCEAALRFPPNREPICLQCGYADYKRAPPELTPGHSDGWPSDYAIAFGGFPARPIAVKDSDVWAQIKAECPYDAQEMSIGKRVSDSRRFPGAKQYLCQDHHNIWLWRLRDGSLIWAPVGVQSGAR